MQVSAGAADCILVGQRILSGDIVGDGDHCSVCVHRAVLHLGALWAACSNRLGSCAFRADGMAPDGSAGEPVDVACVSICSRESSGVSVASGLTGSLLSPGVHLSTDT